MILPLLASLSNMIRMMFARRAPLIILLVLPLAAALSGDVISRRDALRSTAATITAGGAGFVSGPQASNAAAAPETIDMDAINAARARTAVAPASSAASVSAGKTVTKISCIVPSADPSPLLAIRGERGGKGSIKIPRVGYSFYKTAPDQAARCTALALRAGVRHLDLAAQYGSNAEVAKTLKSYLDGGLSAIKLFDNEKDELLQYLDATSAAADDHATKTIAAGLAFRAKAAPPPDGLAGRRGRREGLFLSHKLSNAQQSTDVVSVRRTVKNAIAELGGQYLDLVSIHSPLTDRNRRLATYQALVDLRDSGFVKSIGVCNYGLGPLKELEEEFDKDLPAINQLELSPFNMHKDVVEWCGLHGVAVGCGAWSKLSGVDGPAEGWAVLSDIAKNKGMTKAQVLVRWSLQKGYVCVPRSAAASKVERMAIAENSYGGVNPGDLAEGTTSFSLSDEEIAILDGLDIEYRAGKLGRTDGWAVEDISGVDWDPALVL